MSDDSYILRLLDECREEIKISDSKASIIFAAVATATALLANLLLDEKQQLRTNGAAVTTLSVIAVATLVIARWDKSYDDAKGGEILARVIPPPASRA